MKSSKSTKSAADPVLSRAAEREKLLTENLAAARKALDEGRVDQPEHDCAWSWYREALDLDPDHHESQLGLADCYSFLGTTGFMPFDKAWEKAIQFTNHTSTHYQSLSF